MTGTTPDGTPPDDSTAEELPPAPTGPARFVPPVDAAAQPGNCPYLTDAELESGTGQRSGPTRIRPADPYPVCEFVRSDGSWLATVRVLRLPDERTAVAAVDHYVPRESSNPETRPTGWSGGSMRTDRGSIYGVSMGPVAVIAETNQDRTIASRQIAVAVIGNLGG